VRVRRGGAISAQSTALTNRGPRQKGKGGEPGRRLPWPHGQQADIAGMAGQCRYTYGIPRAVFGEQQARCAAALPGSPAKPSGYY
jgi:hypothetical protein